MAYVDSFVPGKYLYITEYVEGTRVSVETGSFNLGWYDTEYRVWYEGGQWYAQRRTGEYTWVDCDIEDTRYLLNWPER